MQEERWLRLIESEGAEQVALELSEDFLDYVREEGDVLDAESRSKVLLSLLHVPREQLDALEGSIERLLQACEEDNEEWIRVISSIVTRWINNKQNDGEKTDAYTDSFQSVLMEIEKTIAEQQEKKNNGHSHDEEEFLLPLEFVPKHWAFLSKKSLPKAFDLEKCSKNQHFVSKPRPEKRLKVILDKNEVSNETNSSNTPNLPEKIQALLKNAPLLTSENREKILNYFSSNGASLTNDESIPLVELNRKNSTKRPGYIEIEQECIKLTPKNAGWLKTKRIISKLGQV